MVNNWTVRIAALGCTAVMAACGGSDGKRDERYAESQQNQMPRLELTGCVQAGPLETKYVLANVQTGREADQQGQTSDRASDRSSGTITVGSMVQLRSDNERELQKYVGQQVSVTGRLIDSGASTIGTSGAKGNPTAQGDRSLAAETGKHHSEKAREEAGPIGRESMANGTAPIVQVERINPTGQQCGAGSAR
jgi:hypothetical protein